MSRQSAATSTASNAQGGDTERISNANTSGYTDPDTGKFAKGNPGKPRGALNHATRLAQTVLNEEVEGLARRAVELAMSGNVMALKLCLERMVPVHRQRSVEFELPALETAADAVQAAGAVTALVASGHLTPGEGQSLAQVIETQRRAIETADLERRVLLLEGGASGNP